MAVDVRFLGQACFELKAGGVTVLTDPFLTGNPLAAASADEVEPDVILLTHGHADHLGDTLVRVCLAGRLEHLCLVRGAEPVGRLERLVEYALQLRRLGRDEALRLLEARRIAQGLDRCVDLGVGVALGHGRAS